MQSTSSWSAPVHGALTLAFMLAVWPHTAIAQEVGLTLRQALENALASNRQLAAFEYRLAEQEGRQQQAGLYPNPRFDLLIENVGGQGVFRGYENAETTLSIGWLIEPGLPGRRVGVAEARSARARLDAKILRLDVAAKNMLSIITKSRRRNIVLKEQVCIVHSQE